MYLNDLELLDAYIEKCLDMPNPILVRDIDSRGLLMYINFLPSNKEQAKAVVRARLARDGKCFGDGEIDMIAANIRRLTYLREQLAKTNIADAHKTIPILDEMKYISEYILNYYGQGSLPGL